jgi:hypothetical protein
MPRRSLQGCGRIQIVFLGDNIMASDLHERFTHALQRLFDDLLTSAPQSYNEITDASVHSIKEKCEAAAEKLKEFYSGQAEDVVKEFTNDIEVHFYLNGEDPGHDLAFGLMETVALCQELYSFCTGKCESFTIEEFFERATTIAGKIKAREEVIDKRQLARTKELAKMVTKKKEEDTGKYGEYFDRLVQLERKLLAEAWAQLQPNELINVRLKQIEEEISRLHARRPTDWKGKPALSMWDELWGVTKRVFNPSDFSVRVDALAKELDELQGEYFTETSSGVVKPPLLQEQFSSLRSNFFKLRNGEDIIAINPTLAMGGADTSRAASPASKTRGGKKRSPAPAFTALRPSTSGTSSGTPLPSPSSLNFSEIGSLPVESINSITPPASPTPAAPDTLSEQHSPAGVFAEATFSDAPDDFRQNTESLAVSDSDNGLSDGSLGLSQLWGDGHSEPEDASDSDTHDEQENALSSSNNNTGEEGALLASSTNEPQPEQSALVAASTAPGLAHLLGFVNTSTWDFPTNLSTPPEKRSVSPSLHGVPPSQLGTSILGDTNNGIEPALQMRSSPLPGEASHSESENDEEEELGLDLGSVLGWKQRSQLITLCEGYKTHLIGNEDWKILAPQAVTSSDSDSEDEEASQLVDESKNKVSRDYTAFPAFQKLSADGQNKFRAILKVEASIRESLTTGNDVVKVIKDNEKTLATHRRGWAVFLKGLGLILPLAIPLLCLMVDTRRTTGHWTPSGSGRVSEFFDSHGKVLAKKLAEKASEEVDEAEDQHPNILASRFASTNSQ